MAENDEKQFRRPQNPFTQSSSTHSPQASYTPLLHKLNAAFEKSQILKAAEQISIQKSDVIVLFNYDYFFIRELFPHQKIILIINDDFWSSAIAGYDKPLKRALEQVCRTSDSVLTVSQPLADQLKAYCSPQLFFPWSDVAYKSPKRDTVRNLLLYWGYLGNKLDYSYISSLAGVFESHKLDYEIFLVGPILANCKQTKLLEGVAKIRFQERSCLDDLPLDRVLCGFIPYRSRVSHIDVISLPNKASQLLARGLPLLICGMPAFINQPFVLRMTGDLDSDLNILRHIRSSFNDLQPAISAFVTANSAQSRLQSFMACING